MPIRWKFCLGRNRALQACVVTSRYNTHCFKRDFYFLLTLPLLSFFQLPRAKKNRGNALSHPSATLPHHCPYFLFFKKENSKLFMNKNYKVNSVSIWNTWTVWVVHYGMAEAVIIKLSLNSNSSRKDPLAHINTHTHFSSLLSGYRAWHCIGAALVAFTWVKISV